MNNKNNLKNLDRKFICPKQVITQEIDCEMILLDTNEGIYFSLDEVGCCYWKCIISSESLREACEIVANKYHIEYALAYQDGSKLCDELLEKKLITTA